MLGSGDLHRPPWQEAHTTRQAELGGFGGKVVDVVFSFLIQSCWASLHYWFGRHHPHQDHPHYHDQQHYHVDENRHPDHHCDDDDDDDDNRHHDHHCDDDDDDENRHHDHHCDEIMISERHGKTGISTNEGHAFTESKSINLSLSCLGKVAQIIIEKKTYRYIVRQ